MNSESPLLIGSSLVWQMRVISHIFSPLFPQSGRAHAWRNSSTECPTSYRTRHFFDNFTTNEDIAMKFEADLPH
jgi:hypothetical protein